MVKEMNVCQGFLSTYRMMREMLARVPLYLLNGEVNVGPGFLPIYRMVMEMLPGFLSTYRRANEMLARVSSPLSEWSGKCWPGIPLHLPTGEGNVGQVSSPLTDW